MDLPAKLIQYSNICRLEAIEIIAQSQYSLILLFLPVLDRMWIQSVNKNSLKINLSTLCGTYLLANCVPSFLKGSFYIYDLWKD